MCPRSNVSRTARDRARTAICERPAASNPSRLLLRLYLVQPELHSHFAIHRRRHAEVLGPLLKCSAAAIAELASGLVFRTAARADRRECPTAFATETDTVAIICLAPGTLH